MAGKGKRKWFRSQAVTVVLFVAAGVLLLVGTIGGAQAAISVSSETYRSRVQMSQMGVTLSENDEVISYQEYEENGAGWRGETGSLLKNLPAEGESFQPGRIYKEVLTVSNTGEIDQYVRVTIYKYWTEKDGVTKQAGLSPDMIRLHLLTDQGWLVDTASSTKERTVLYYQNVLGAGDTVELSDTLQIDPAVAVAVSQTTTGGTTVTDYLYDGAQFWIRAEVDAVQTHNAEDAIWSAWGRQLSVENGMLSLREPANGNDN